MSDDQTTGVGPAPPETVAPWIELVATMGPDELDSFEQRTFRQWDRASLGDLRAGDQSTASGARRVM